MDPGDSDKTINITDFINSTAHASCKYFDDFDLQLVPLTASYVARVTGSATLTLFYGKYQVQWNPLYWAA